MTNNFQNQNNPWNNFRNNEAPFYNDTYRPMNGYDNYNRNNTAPLLSGRLVNSLDEITPQEVPMDGSVSLFPKNDYSAIYAKTWTKDGTIATVKYVPEANQAAPQKTALEARLDKIDQRFDKLERMLTRNNKPYRKHQPVKKEEPIDG